MSAHLVPMRISPFAGIDWFWPQYLAAGLRLLPRLLPSPTKRIRQMGDILHMPASACERVCIADHSNETLDFISCSGFCSVGSCQDLDTKYKSPSPFYMRLIAIGLHLYSASGKYARSTCSSRKTIEQLIEMTRQRHFLPRDRDDQCLHIVTRFEARSAMEWNGSKTSHETSAGRT